MNPHHITYAEAARDGIDLSRTAEEIHHERKNTMKSFREELDAPLPQTRTDWEGKPQPIKYPKGTILARCGEALLIQCSKHQFATVYGLQIDHGLTKQTALESFADSCFHQAACEGLTID